MYGFCVQQLFGVHLGYYLDIQDPINPNDPSIAKFRQLSSQNCTLGQKGCEGLEVARIANATNYTTDNSGEPPCRCHTF
jgi:hypothetical protein